MDRKLLANQPFSISDQDDKYIRWECGNGWHHQTLRREEPQPMKCGWCLKMLEDPDIEFFNWDGMGWENPQWRSKQKT